MTIDIIIKNIIIILNLIPEIYQNMNHNNWRKEDDFKRITWIDNEQSYPIAPINTPIFDNHQSKAILDLGVMPTNFEIKRILERYPEY